MVLIFSVTCQRFLIAIVIEFFFKLIATIFADSGFLKIYYEEDLNQITIELDTKLRRRFI